MGQIEINHTGSGGGVVLSSDGTSLLLGGSAIGGGASALTIEAKTSAYTVVAGDLGKVINCTANTFTVSLTAAGTLGAGFNVVIWNTSATNTHAITIDPNGSETIDGLATLILRRGEGMQVVCDGSNFQTGNKKTMRGYADNILSTEARPVASGNRSISLGTTATASGSESFSVGYGATAAGAYSVALGRANASTTGTIAIGFEAASTAAFATAIGGNSNAQGSKAPGSGSVSLGGSYASGTNSLAAAILNNASSYGATGTSSIAIGRNAKASDTYSVGIGYSVNSSGTHSIAMGDRAQATASGTGWGASATGSSSVSIGDGAIARGRGKFSFASGNSAVGSSMMQSGQLTISLVTTNNTAAGLNSYNYGAAGSDNQLILPNNSAFAFHGTIVARQKASEGTACAAWRIEGLIRKEGSSGSTVLVNSATTVLDNTPNWGMALSADTSNGALKVQATGASSTNIRWTGTLYSSEVTYA